MLLFDCCVLSLLIWSFSKFMSVHAGPTIAVRDHSLLRRLGGCLTAGAIKLQWFSLEEAASLYQSARREQEQVWTELTSGIELYVSFTNNNADHLNLMDENNMQGISYQILL